MSNYWMSHQLLLVTKSRFADQSVLFNMIICVFCLWPSRKGKRVIFVWLYNELYWGGVTSLNLVRTPWKLPFWVSHQSEPSSTLLALRKFAWCGSASPIMASSLMQNRDQSIARKCKYSGSVEDDLRQECGTKELRFCGFVKEYKRW